MVNFAEMMAKKRAERVAAEQAGSATPEQKLEGILQEEYLERVIEAEKVVEEAKAVAPAVARVNPFAKLKSTTPLVDQAVKDLESGEMSLDDLDGLEDEGIRYEGKTPVESQFDDELPAQAPVRELPEDLTKQQRQFVDLIDGVYGVIGDPELLGNVIKSIMIELKANPQYMQMVAKDDVRAWVKAMRDSMGLARIKKQEKVTKKSGGAGSKSSKGADADMMADLDDLLGGVEL